MLLFDNLERRATARAVTVLQPFFRHLLHGHRLESDLGRGCRPAWRERLRLHIDGLFGLYRHDVDDDGAGDGIQNPLLRLRIEEHADHKIEKGHQPP